MSLIDIEDIVLTNNEYRKIILTNGQLQVVAMSLMDEEIIPEEIHYSSSQFIKIEEGGITAHVNGTYYNVGKGNSIVIPAGATHEIVSTGNTKLYTIYIPPVHTIMGGYRLE